MWNTKGRVLKKVFVHTLKVDGDKVKLPNKTKTNKKSAPYDWCKIAA